ncbi:MAG: hypothetical protein IPJ33_12145 [Gammaproteobacteria bacterium]|jgi:hypothetical protein|nr:hypothetical protein [Gammaproteobacteria bacterium]MBP6053245.1 hypothetical protein [Pseudomonadales bacterium]MBK7171401.1 hypothetical protein [Gammaproteobacteria bacterium]MBK7521434.1 hypothetical protein [Gammaproteobacteria bacterium]MBK7729212.1 hypothetical protein [Gammaproteobacteria bacterium]
MNSEQQTADAGPDAAASSTISVAATEFDRQLKLGFAHLLLAVALLSLWAAADVSQAVTGLALSSLLSTGMAIVAAVVFTTLVHEWCHFLGAKFSGAAYTVPATLGLFVFNFDFARNSLAQFYSMSHAGQAGSWLAVLLLYLAVPMDTAGRVMLVCAAIGSAVFAGLIEWPVLRRTRRSGNPLLELARIDRAGLYRSARIASALTLLLWLLAI